MRCEMSKTVNANIQKFTTSRGFDSFVFVVSQTWQDHVVSYARVTLRDKKCFDKNSQNYSDHKQTVEWENKV